MKSILKTAALTLTAVVAFTSTLSAAPIVDPAGKQGAYRLIFQTSLKITGSSGNIADYNAHVTSVANGEAALAGLNTTWTAVASTGTVDARDNTGTNPISDGTGVAIYGLNGTKMVDDNADLWDGSALDAGFSITFEDGSSLPAFGPDTLVWTGTQPNGTKHSLSFALGGTTSFAILGQGNIPFDTRWIEWAGDGQSNERSLYAISGVLWDIPTPGAALLLGFGLIGLTAARRAA